MDTTTSCYKLLTEEDGYFHRASLGDQPFHILTLAFPPNLTKSRGAPYQNNLKTSYVEKLTEAQQSA